MTRFKALLKVQILGMFGLNKILHSKDKKEHSRAAVMGLLAILLVLLMLGYSTGLGIGLTMLGLAEMLPAFMVMAGALLTVALTFMKSTGCLFGMKDMDMVMSLPVSSRSIIMSRLLNIYLMNFFISFIAFVPSAIIYGITTKCSFSAWIMMGLTLFFNPLLPMTAALLIGALITAAAARFRYKNVIVIILSVAMITAVLVGSFGLGGEEQLRDIGTLAAQTINRVYPPANLLTDALATGNWGSFGLFLICSLLPAVLFVWGLSIFFIKINTAMSNQYTKGNYKVGELKSVSPLKAAYKREIKCYTSCSIYLINTSISAIMVILVGVAFLMVEPEQIEAFIGVPGIMQKAGKAIPFIMSLVGTLSSTTSVSLSIEGKSRWINSALPVESKVLYQAKIALNLTLMVPAVILSGGMISYGMKAGILDTILYIAVPMAYVFFISVAGLAINLKFPKYDWTNEQQVVKGSLSVGLSMGVGFLSALIPGALVLIFYQYATIILLLTLTVICATAIYLYDKMRCTRLYV